jgi:hypothetical protein
VLVGGRLEKYIVKKQTAILIKTAAPVENNDKNFHRQQGESNYLLNV